MTWEVYYYAVIGQVSSGIRIKKDLAKKLVDSRISDVKAAFATSPQTPTGVIAKRLYS
jgi:hypothetical protein